MQIVFDKEVYAIETDKGNYNHIEAYNFREALDRFNNKIRITCQDFSEIKHLHKFSKVNHNWFEIPL